jgi:hypothetical protein
MTNLAEFSSPDGRNLRDVLLSKESIQSVDCDEETGLMLLSHTNCTRESDPLVQASRGVIVDRFGNHVLSNTPFTEEFTSLGTMDYSFPMWRDDACILESLEGTVLRVFCYYGKWFVSTYRSLDAHKSRWMSSESFGARFERGVVNRVLTNNSEEEEESPEAISSLFRVRFLSGLDPAKAYVFLLRSEQSNRIACEAPEKPRVHFLFSTGKSTEQRIISLGDDAELRQLFPLQQFDVDYVDRFMQAQYSSMGTLSSASVSIPSTQGFLIVASDGSRMAKLYTPMYARCLQVRGTGPIRNRYIELLSSTTISGIWWCSPLWYILQLYPENAALFDSINAQFSSAVQTILRLYFDVKVRKNSPNVPGPMYPVIVSCHKWHCIDRSRNLVNASVVQDHLKNQSSQSISKILRCVRNVALA